MKSKIVKVCGLTILCLLLIGCNKNDNNNNNLDDGFMKPSNSEEREELAKDCEVAVQKVYDEHKVNYNNQVIEGFCSKNSIEGDYYSIYFKINDNLIYQYSYSSVKDDVNLSGNTEEYEQNKKKCDDGSATQYQSLVCSVQKVLLNTYASIKKSASNEYLNNLYIEIDVSKLK